ncbi:hypothetical protein TNCV_1989141 [Trichonephila clavipes]|nr:hypothetical protein TNCV_1989141 [Trichonephila clavipes]
MQASKKEQRGVIRFLAVKGVGDRERHGRMKAVYGEFSLCRSSAVEWSKRFLGRRCSTWTGSSYYHTLNDCGRECFSLGQPQNHHERDPSIIKY